MSSESNQNHSQQKPVKAHPWQGAKFPHWVAVIGFSLIALAITIGGWWSFTSQKRDIRRESQQELTGIATLKARQITEWRREKLNDAELLRSNRIFAGQIEAWIKRGRPHDRIYNKLLTRLNDNLNAHRYHALLLLDKSANPLLNVGENYGLDENGRNTALKAMSTQQSLFAEIYNRHPKNEGHGHDHPEEVHVHLDLLIPLLVGETGSLRSIGAIVIRLDPEKFLFPLVESWPIQSSTAETVLLKPTEKGAIRLSGRRHEPETFSREIKPPEGRMTPPKMVSAKKEGVLEHLDYREVPVISVIKQVTDSPWYLVAKIDQTEIFAPIYSLARQITILVIAFISLSGITVFYWWRQMRAAYLASHYQSELDKQMLEQRFYALSKHANDIILLVDHSGRIVEANDRAIERFGYPREQMIGIPFKKLRREEDAEQFEEQRQQLLEKGTLLYEALLVKSDGSTFPVENNARVIELNGKKYFQGIMRDVSERKKAEEQIRFLAHHDSLTGLPNRNLLQDRLNQNLARAKRNKTKSAVLFLDFDRFKNINDSLGHSVGDGVLKEVAKRLSSCLREGDTVARVGGDEFVILMSDLEDAADAVKVARKVTDLGIQPYVVEEQKFRLTISIGISVFPDDGGDIETLLKNADSAMYHAKKSGRDTFYFYTDDMNAQTLRILKLENDLQHALDNDGFALHYQPQIDLTSGAITGVEALLRWNHPQHGNIPPADFIPLAEERGLITPIGNWVLETACQQSVAWQQQGMPPIRVAVNISALQLHHVDFYERVANILTSTGMNPELLELELTESAVMQNEESAQVLLKQLKALGLQLAIDDFGTGYSSLSHLKRFPIDTLKIDRSFIKDLPLDSDDSALTQAIIGIGRSLKHKVIAEGVETLEQQSFLQQEGCDEMQGFYFSHPVPAEQITQLMGKAPKAS